MFNSLWYHQISNILKKDQAGHDVLLISCELPYDRLCKGCVLKWKSKRTTNTRLNGFSDWLLFLYQITNESVRALAKNFGVKEISLEVTEHKFDAKKKKKIPTTMWQILWSYQVCVLLSEAFVLLHCMNLTQKRDSWWYVRESETVRHGWSITCSVSGPWWEF